MLEVDSIIKILEETFNVKGVIMLSTIVGINLCLTILSFLYQIYIRKQNRKDFRIQLREQKRIEVYEKLFNNLYNLSYFNAENQREDYINQIATITKSINSNRIYIDRKIFRVANRILDYHKNIIQDISSKDYLVEVGLMEEFSKYFNS